MLKLFGTIGTVIVIVIAVVGLVWLHPLRTREPYPSNVYGPVGPPGPTGPTGPAGPTGPTGPPAQWTTPWKGTRGQYVVVQHRPNGINQAVSLAEISVVTLDPAQDRREMQFHMLAEMSSNPQNLPLAQATDRNMASVLQTGATSDSEWIRFDLQTMRALARVVVYAQSGNELVLTECDLQILDDQQRLVRTVPFPTTIQNSYIFEL